MSGTTLVRCKAGLYVPQQVSSLSVTSSQESPMNMAIASLALEELHSDSSNSLPSGNRSSRRLREFIPETRKDSDYWIKRQRNNEAAKRSREKRRLNDVIMGRQIVQLTNENKRLRMELDAIRRTYGSPPPPPSVDMPYNVDNSYGIGGSVDGRRNSLPSPESIALSTSNAITSLSRSSFARMPVESSHMPFCCDLESSGGKPLSFEERENLIGITSVPSGSTCAVYPTEADRFRRQEVEDIFPVIYGSEGSRTLSLANPTSSTSSPKDCVAVSSALEHHAEVAGSQVNGRMPPLVRHTNCFRTTVSQSHLDTGLQQENATSGWGTFPNQASRKHQVELALLFSDVSSTDENDVDTLTGLHQLQSLEERPLNLSMKTGSSPFKDERALPVSHRSTGFMPEYQGTAVLKSRMWPVLENLEQVTSAYSQPTSFSCHNRNRNVLLKASSEVEPQSPEVPRLSSSFLMSSHDGVPEKKGVTKRLTREMADSFLERSSCSQNFHFRACQQNLDVPVHEICDEQETQSVSALSQQRISGTEVYTFLPSDFVETPKKAEKSADRVLCRRGVPLKLWHKWLSSFSGNLKVAVEGREHDPCSADEPISFLK